LYPRDGYGRRSGCRPCAARRNLSEGWQQADEAAPASPRQFGEEIRSGSIVVKNASGKIVSRGPNGKDPTDVRRLRVALKPNLKNGRYKVSWKVASADGDPEAGTFAFRLI
jgi:methionine-rich copper-binding protein CopC